METSLFSSGQNSHRFALPIRQFSNRSDLQHVPTLGTFLSYERSLLRSFGSPQLRSTCPKKTSKFSSQNVKLFQRKRQTFPAETSRFSSGNVKIFQRKRQDFPAIPWKMQGCGEVTAGQNDTLSARWHECACAHSTWRGE